MSIERKETDETENLNRFGWCLSDKRKLKGNAPSKPSTLILCRHGESTWNVANKFTGWYDCPLSAEGEEEVVEAGKLILEEGYKVDVGFTSYLKRAIQTMHAILIETDSLWIPVTKAWELNERHYGGLTGLDKLKTVEKYGSEQVHIWRRSYDIPPPAAEKASPYHPSNDAKYNHLKFSDDFTETLATTLDRVVPYFQSVIEPELRKGKTVIVAAHGNSLRALVKYFDNIDEKTIPNLNIPTGTPLVYKFDSNMDVIPSDEAISPLRGRYLGDQEVVRARIEGVQNQTKKA